MPTEGCAALTKALDLLTEKTPHRVRDQVHYLVRLARCYLLQGDVEQACGIATEAVVLSQAIGSARVMDRLGEFEIALQPFTASKSARDFSELYTGCAARRPETN
jgi:hypothetical protein